jgi:hypothetical protein
VLSDNLNTKSINGKDVERDFFYVDKQINVPPNVALQFNNRVTFNSPLYLSNVTEFSGASKTCSFSKVCTSQLKLIDKLGNSIIWTHDQSVQW